MKSYFFEQFMRHTFDKQLIHKILIRLPMHCCCLFLKLLQNFFIKSCMPFLPLKSRKFTNPYVVKNITNISIGFFACFSSK